MTHRSVVRVWAVAIRLSLSLSACSQFESEQSKLGNIHTVAIVSAVGDQFSVTSSELSTAGGGDQHFSIKSWKLDDLIVNRAGASLQTRYQVQPVSYDLASYYAAVEEDSPIALANMMRDDPLKKLLRAQAAQQGLDAYIVIAKATSKVGPRERNVTGLGLVSYGAMFSSNTQIHALYTVKVYDAHSFDLLAERRAAPLDETAYRRLSGPAQMVDETYLPTAEDPVHNEKLKRALTDMIERSLPQTLNDLHLG